MRRIGLTLCLVAAIGLVIGVSLYSSWGQDGSRAPAKRVTLGTEQSDLWPASRSWVWNVDPIARAADFAAGMKDPWEAPAREVHAGEAPDVSAAAT
jgi:hypothetical protein